MRYVLTAIKAVNAVSDPSKMQDIVRTLTELHDLGKVKNDKDLQERIDEYFKLCAYGNIRPGIESMACALGVSRTTVFNWINGIKCTDKRCEIMQRAKSVIDATLEQMSLNGLISPPTGIFLMKNWLGYADSYELSTNKVEQMPEQFARSREEILASLSADMIDSLESEDE